ncbi:hypothetical protein CAEBREN_08741 [Caenorhabditis brenneri]|uniref:Uncharacterized protein n=1 Tax=Caenorhabditis brenneri TaxID=135651 RepID=G0MMD3_CAEBE|nr:hypothetical protein CAEBREN_08741 [Caenorhabditis brenneri]
MMRAQQSHTGYDAQNLENSPPPNQMYEWANFQHYQNYLSSSFLVKESTQEERCRQYSRQSSAEHEAVERENSPPSDHLECHFFLPDSPDTQRDSCSPQSSVVSSKDEHLINGLNKKQRVAAARDRYRRIPKDEPKPTSRSKYDRNRRLRENAILAQNPSELTPEEQAEAERILATRKRIAETARLRYHRMSAEEKKQYNRMREAARKKRSKKTTDTKSKEVYMDDDACDQESSHRHNQHDE